MIVGTPKEIKNHEYRVGLTPESAHELVAHGHHVLVETGAGEGIGAHDAAYEKAGAEVVATAAEIFARADMVVKVKEPQAVERAMLRKGQILYTYLHLAPDPDQTKDLMASGAVCIAYETVTGREGGLPLLKPMSQVAGRMSIQAGATALEKANGGRGVLLGGVPGVMPAKVTVIGGGVVGFNAAQMAAGLGADVTSSTAIRWCSNGSPCTLKAAPKPAFPIRRIWRRRWRRRTSSSARCSSPARRRPNW